MARRPAEQRDVALPASMALAWGLADRPSRGPKRALTIERIVTSAVAVAEAEGIGAVSMARVASELGVATMALYRYVPSKDDLLELMVDHAVGLPPAAVEGESWRAGLHRWAMGVRDAYLAQPWTLHVPIVAPPLGPNNVRWLENCLAVTRPLPLSAPERTSIVVLLSGFVRSTVRLQLEIAQGGDGRAEPGNYDRLLRGLIDERGFPEISAVLSQGGFGDEDPGMDDPDFDLDFGIERILDGIEALVARNRAAARRARGRS